MRAHLSRKMCVLLLYRESEDGGVVSVFKQGALPYSAKKSVSSAKRLIVSKVGKCTEGKKTML